GAHFGPGGIVGRWRRRPDPIVGDGDRRQPFRRDAEADADDPGLVVREAMLERIAERFGDEKPQRHRTVCGDRDRWNIDLDRHPAAGGSTGLLYHLTEFDRELSEIEVTQVVALVEMAVEKTERPDAALQFGQSAFGGFVAQPIGLNAHKAGQHLQIVLNAMMNFLEHRLLLLDRAAHVWLVALDSLGHIGERIGKPTHLAWSA